MGGKDSIDLGGEDSEDVEQRPWMHFPLAEFSFRGWKEAWKRVFIKAMQSTWWQRGKVSVQENRATSGQPLCIGADLLLILMGLNVGRWDLALLPCG